jgi:dissimilatory sulfite reductase (desulfoviridin) alpha/beta subunit
MFFFFFLLKVAFAMEILDLISVYILHHLLSGCPNSCNAPHSQTVVVLYRTKIAVCSEFHTKRINALCGQNVEIPFIKTCGT